MRGCLAVLAFIAGSGAVHGLPMLPSAGTVRWLLMFLAVLATLLLACIVLMWRKLTHGANLPGWWNTGLCVFALCSGFLLASLRAEYRLADKLDAVDAGQVFRLDLRVATLPRQDAGRRAFVAEVLSSRPEGVPRRIQVSWLAPPDASGKAEGFPAIMPGQVWRMAVTIKPPWGPRNPHAFDYEGHLFAQDIRATGTVRGSPKLLRDDGWAGLSIAAQRARHYIREALLPHLEGMRYGAVLLALSIGDQASVAASDWQVFNRSGITHLVSISGSHVTMVAAMGGAVVFWGWPVGVVSGAGGGSPGGIASCLAILSSGGLGRSRAAHLPDAGHDCLGVCDPTAGVFVPCGMSGCGRAGRARPLGLACERLLAVFWRRHDIAGQWALGR
jgi:competence protein ComEC